LVPELTPDSVPEKHFQDLLITQLKDTKLLNVSTKPFKNEDEDLITITTEVYPTEGPIEKRFVYKDFARPRQGHHVGWNNHQMLFPLKLKFSAKNVNISLFLLSTIGGPGHC
jgi:hypothetical protein